MPDKDNTYDESKIQTLSPLDHIRLRSGMYIGRLGDGENFDDGIYVLLKEIVDNAVDEFIMGHGSEVRVDINDHNKVIIRDFGRGIPLGKVVECVSHINTGAKYNDDVFQFSVGLNGVGTKAVNALSSYFLVRSVREKAFSEAVFERGKLVSKREGKLDEPNGVYVEFIPDLEIFGPYAYRDEYIARRMIGYACLNRGLKLYFNGEEFLSENGIADFLHNETGDDVLYPAAYAVGDKLEMAFTHTNEGYGESYFSFVNGQYTSDGGTHLVAFKEGLVKGVNEFYKASFSPQDIREGIACAVSVKIKDPIFESQTKNKLGNTDIRAPIVALVKDLTEDFLHKNPQTVVKLKEKILANERLRKELSSVRKEAREAAKRISINIPKLNDCKLHLGDKGGDESQLFLVEGDSAGGTFVSCRDVYTQAIFKLRGKPENCFGLSRGAIYKNKELYNLMMALGIENDCDGLRYGKVILATDADVDGFHIRNLLLTFFLTYFEDIALKGRLYILETPLFRVKNKKETVYCYNEAERNKAQKTLGRDSVTARFKGLGEISPKEFGLFIGSDIRLQAVDVAGLKNMKETLTFYMGKNTPERREYIMNNLVEDAV